MDKRRIRENILIIFIAILIGTIFFNYKIVFEYISKVFDLITPFIVGFAIAFLVNRPYMFFKTKVFSFIFNSDSKNNKNQEKIKSFLSIFTVYFLFISIVSILISFIIPQVANSITILSKNISEYQNTLESVYNNIINFFNIQVDISKAFLNFWNNFSSYILEALSQAFPRIVTATVNVTTGVLNFIIGIIVSIYIISSKDKLILQVKKIFYSIFPKKYLVKTIDVLSYANKTFSSFIIGQLLDATVVSILCFIGMTILDMPFSILISVIIGITNIIPIVGPFLGTIPCSFIILMVNPQKAIWFIILIIIIQQLDANIITPKILGESTGVPGLFVIFAIIVGGGLFGVIGMVIGVPTISVIIYVFRSITNNIFKKRFGSNNIENVEKNLLFLD